MTNVLPAKTRIVRTMATTALLATALFAPRAASATEADSKTTCADAYKSAQVQKKSGAFKRARESLLVCVSDRCPAVLHPDCTRWLTEVEAAAPSVVFAAKGENGKDVTDVRVIVDGEVVAKELDGKSLTLDPGSHVLRFEHPGQNPIEQSIAIREGEKSRVVAVSWAKAPPETPVAASDDGGKTTKRVRETPTAAWVFGGIGLAGLATFTTMSFVGMSQRSDLEKSCFGSCEQGQVDSVKTNFLIADIGLGVGLASLGVATYFFIAGGSREVTAMPTTTAKSANAVRVRVSPTTSGGTVGLSGVF